MKKNWKIKKVINIFFYKLKGTPFLVRFLVRIIWFSRSGLRGFQRPIMDNNGGILSSQKYRFICVGNPKVGSSSLKKYFNEEISDGKIDMSLSYSSYSAQISLDDFHTCSFVRDPVDRIYSCWKDKITNQNRFADIFIITRFRGLYPDMPFAEFITWLLNREGSDENADRHWLSQHKLLANSQGEVNFDYIGTMKDFSADFNIIAEQVGLRNKKIGSENSSKNERRKLSEELDLETILKIKKRYVKDYEIFNFDKN
jgi:hypothetical protein